MSIRDLADRIRQASEQLEQTGRLTERLRKLEPAVEVSPGKKLSGRRLREFWLRSALNPNSPLLDPQRREILDRYNRGEGGIAPRDQTASGQRNDAHQGSHEPTPRRDGGNQMVPRSRIDHALIDPHAYSRLSLEEKSLANSMVSSSASDRYYSQDLQAHRQRMRRDHNSLSSTERTEVEESRDRRRDEFWDQEGYRDHDSRFNNPSSQPEDNRPDPPEDNRPSPPDNDRSGGGGLAEGLGDLLGRRRR